MVKSYNPGTRTINATVNVTALSDLTGVYMINYVMTEDNIIAYQSSYSGCPPGGSNYVHKHLVRDMINGAYGDTVFGGGTWTQGTTIFKTMSYVIDTGWVADNCDLNVFVYKLDTPLNSAGHVQQTYKNDILTGVEKQGETAEGYYLSQNFPNPFNPVTRIRFNIPKSGNVSFKVYDVLGNEIATVYNDYLKTGIYNVEFDGSGLPSGLYFYKLVTKEFTDTKKMMLIK